jgi:signal transduction histidine kinase
MTSLLRRRLARGVPSDTVRLAEGLDTIARAAEGMHNQITELLDLTRLQMGRSLDLDLVPVDIAALVTRLIQTQLQVSERHTFDLHIIGTVPSGLFDPARLERALTNVLGNALKYSPDGGVIDVTLRRIVDQDGTWLEVQVSDQGVGIPAAELPRVFERFFRATNVSGRITGTGLGLAGARQTVEEHGGTITLTSQEGHGTKVLIRLPLRPVDDGEAARSEQPTER